jgi:predicted aspartyl protease
VAITFLKVKVINPEHPKKMKECQSLVDSGTVYSVVPKNILKSLGIKPTSFEEFILADGEIVKRSIGNAYFEYQGKVRAAPVVFGDKGIFLSGATTIEAFGLILDPIRRELRPLPMVLMEKESTWSI